MSRFYISDGARPGRRTPASDYATKPSGVGSDILNEAQAIARGRKLAATQPSTPPVLPARYWRVIARSPVHSPVLNAWFVVELAMWDGGINRALAAAPRASSSYDAFRAASNLNDGVLCSQSDTWCSAVSPLGDVSGQWIGYDFGAPVTIDQVVLHLIGEGYNVSDVDVQSSSDDVAWNLVKSFTGLDSAGLTHTLNIP